MSKKGLPASASKSSLPIGFVDLLGDVKLRIQTAQTRAMTRVNAELVRLYWDIGGLIEQRQQQEGWGASVIPKLSAELRNELPELKGFSERNIDRMVAFYRSYPDPASISPQLVAKLQNTPFSPQLAAKIAGEPKVPQAVAQLSDDPKMPQAAAQLGLESLLWKIPWGHHTPTSSTSSRSPNRSTSGNSKPNWCGIWKSSCWSLGRVSPLSVGNTG